MAEGFGEAGEGPGDQPEFGVFPSRDEAGDDIGKAALGDDGVGIGENGAAGVEGGLRREATLGCVVLGHGGGVLWGEGGGDLYGGLNASFAINVMFENITHLE